MVFMGAFKGVYSGEGGSGLWILRGCGVCGRLTTVVAGHLDQLGLSKNPPSQVGQQPQLLRCTWVLDFPRKNK